MRVDYSNIPDEYTQYAKKVLNDEIPAGEYIHLVAKRFFEFLKRDDVYFDTDKADKPVKFIAKLKHTESPFTGKPFILEPWQKFVVYCIFGLYWKKNEKRVCRSAYLQIARKCGKSSLAAALGLYGLVADGEIGAEIYLVSPSTSQTKQDYKYTKNYALSVNKGGIFKVLQSSIHFEPTKSMIKCLSPEAKLGDGYSPHFAIIDEYHAMDTNALPNVMISGMGIRRNPLMLYITTAGFNLGGPCKEYHDMCIEVLRGMKEDDTLWPFIYELEVDDDWTDPKVWPKAVPSMPDIVTQEFMEERIQHAKNNPSDEVDVRTKNLNQWVSSSTVWIKDDKIVANMEHVPIEAFKDEYIYGSIDLAYTSDLTAYTIMMPPNEYRTFHPNAFVFKTFFYLPEDRLTDSKNWMKYRSWKNKNWLVTNPGDITDYQYILDEILAQMGEMNFINLSYDSWQAMFMIVKAEQAGVPCAPFSQSLGNFNKVCQTFEMLISKGMIVIDDNPIVRWNFQNVDMYVNSTGLKKPKKPKDVQQKVDGVITMLQCLGNWLADGGDGDVTFVS